MQLLRASSLLVSILFPMGVLAQTGERIQIQYPQQGETIYDNSFQLTVHAPGNVAYLQITITRQPKDKSKSPEEVYSKKVGRLSGDPVFNDRIHLAQGINTIEVHDFNDPSNNATVTVTSTGKAWKEPWEARAIVGFHQAGAASARSDQNFFFDFFVSRGLGDDKSNWGNQFSIWGNVRVASVPQQVSTSIAEFSQTFAQQVGSLPVNELAQAAEFQSGIEWRFTSDWIWNPGLIAFYGATGVFDPVSTHLRVFRAPQEGEAQYDEYKRQILDEFPEAEGREFVGLVPPERDQFFRMWGTGMRFSRFYGEKGSQPGTFTFTVGQDEAITGGRFESCVGRFDAFYPLSVSKIRLYLFGTTNLRLFNRGSQRAPLILEELEVTETPDSTDPNQIAPFDSRIAVVPLSSNRDTYRIGVGIDLVSLLELP